MFDLYPRRVRETIRPNQECFDNWRAGRLCWRPEPEPEPGAALPYSAHQASKQASTGCVPSLAKPSQAKCPGIESPLIPRLASVTPVACTPSPHPLPLVPPVVSISGRSLSPLRPRSFLVSRGPSGRRAAPPRHVAPPSPYAAISRLAVEIFH